MRCWEDPAIAGQRGNEDSLSWVHQRFNFRINIEAFENTKLVTQMFSDKQWGVGGAARIQSWRWLTVAVEAYWIEGLIPGTAAKFELGNPYFAAESGGWGAANKILQHRCSGRNPKCPTQ